MGEGWPTRRYPADAALLEIRERLAQVQTHQIIQSLDTRKRLRGIALWVILSALVQIAIALL